MTSTTTNDLAALAGVRPTVRRFQSLTSHTAGLFALAVMVMLAFSLLTPSTYPSALNLQAIAYATPEIALLALAVAVAMSTAGIDLSIVATANLSALVTATTSIALVGGGAGGGVATVIGIAAGLLTGAACGAINGILVALAGIAPILATLATMTLFTGTAVIITLGKPVYGLPEELLQLGTGTVAVIPVSFWLLAVVVAVLWFVMNRTRFGIRLILIGTSVEAADYTGLRRRAALVRAYALCGTIAAVAGVLMSARAASAAADYGSSYLLLAITIAVLGGTRATGGNAPVVGVAVAAVVLQMISSGFNLLNVSPYVYLVVQGIILIVVLVLELRRGGIDRLIGRWFAVR